MDLFFRAVAFFFILALLLLAWGYGGAVKRNREALEWERCRDENERRRQFDEKLDLALLLNAHVHSPAYREMARKEKAYAARKRRKKQRGEW